MNDGRQDRVDSVDDFSGQTRFHLLALLDTLYFSVGSALGIRFWEDIAVVDNGEFPGPIPKSLRCRAVYISRDGRAQEVMTHDRRVARHDSQPAPLADAADGIGCHGSQGIFQLPQSRTARFRGAFLEEEMNSGVAQPFVERLTRTRVPPSLTRDLRCRNPCRSAIGPGIAGRLRLPPVVFLSNEVAMKLSATETLLSKASWGSRQRRPRGRLSWGCS